MTYSEDRHGERSESMLLARKKKIKIAKMLAAIIYIIENENDISPESFNKLVENIFEISYGIGGFSMMDATMNYVETLEKGANA